MPGMSGHSASRPGLVRARPLLEWLDDVFAAWDWPLDPDRFAPHVPAGITTPTALRRWLLATDTDYPTRDRVWAQTVTAAREAPNAQDYRFLAVGLALAGLRNYRRRIRIRHHGDLPDVHADLVTGFLTRLTTIDVRHPNVAGRLIDSAIGYAARRHRAHPPTLPATAPDHLPDTASMRGPGTVLRPDGMSPPADEAALALGDSTLGDVTSADLAPWLRAAGARITDADVELIAATRLAGRSLAEVAATHGIPVTAAYKRRRRAEQRVADALHATREPSTADPDTSRLTS